MRITDSAMQLASGHTAIEFEQRQQSLEIDQGGDRPSGDNGQQSGNAVDRQLKRQALEQVAKVNISSRGKAAHANRGRAWGNDRSSRAAADLNLRVLMALIERLTGKVVIPQFDQSQSSGDTVQSVDGGGGATAATAGDTGSGGQGSDFSLSYSSNETHYEAETTTFQAKGVINTADGKQIDINVSLAMSREFMSQQRIDIKAGQALQDPLVINFDGNATHLTDRNFSFDINSDGRKEQIAFTGSGSGLLALDLNSDGVINNGNELFGASTGNGFAQLAGYDSDGNGWIDENDPVFNRLRVWTKDSAGQDQLSSLADKGVGAIYLGNAATPFSVKDGGNALLGQVRSTGVFLNENGTAGIVQQIDLAV